MAESRASIVWTCPLCLSSLREHLGSMLCENGHSFDVAKEGYVNLLPPNKKRSAEPGDSASMVASRREIHDAALYAPLADHLCALLSEIAPHGRVLDIGCGEGYYDGIINQALPRVLLNGVDIAKPAVRAAAKRYKSNHYAVASSNGLPVASESIDACFSIFAPTNPAEISRVLRNGGAYIEVGPAPNHLCELREALYPNAREHKTLRTDIAGLQLKSSGSVEYNNALSTSLIRAIIDATPMAHRGEPSMKASLLSQPGMELTFSFSWRLHQKKPSNTENKE